MNPNEFSQASESFKAANPHLFDNGVPRQLEPEEDPVPTKEEWKDEKQLQDQIDGFLRREGTVAIRSRMDRATSNNVGTPDFLFAIAGRAIAWEIKLPGKKLTKAQEKMQLDMIQNGWQCRTIYGYDEAKRIYLELKK